MSPRLTFGVEFEFALATLPENTFDPIPSDSRPVRGIISHYTSRELPWLRKREVNERFLKKKVADKLNAAGLPALVLRDAADEGEVDSQAPWAQGSWVVTTDPTIRYPIDDHDWWDIEVQSPPYLFCRESLEAVMLACRVLTSSFRINVNDSCGLHVHVGNGNDNFHFETMRNLMAFLWAFEPTISQLHPAHRLNRCYFRSLRASSNLALAEPSATEAVARILQQTDKETLLELVGDQHGHFNIEAYNVRNIRRARIGGTEPERKVTIEFRQHEGTLDGSRVVNWIKTVVGLVQLAEECDPFFMMALVTEYALQEDRDGEEYRIEDLLRDTGLEEPALFYGDRPHLS